MDVAPAGEVMAVVKKTTYENTYTNKVALYNIDFFNLLFFMYTAYGSFVDFSISKKLRLIYTKRCYYSNG